MLFNQCIVISTALLKPVIVCVLVLTGTACYLHLVLNIGILRLALKLTILIQIIYMQVTKLFEVGKLCTYLAQSPLILN